MRNIGAYAWCGHYHCDRTDRARFCTTSMPNAFMSTGNDCLAAEHREHVTFRADCRASRTAETESGVDAWVQSLGTLGSQS